MCAQKQCARWNFAAPRGSRDCACRECGEEPRRTEEFAAYIKGILGGFNIARHGGKGNALNESMISLYIDRE